MAIISSSRGVGFGGSRRRNFGFDVFDDSGAKLDCSGGAGGGGATDESDVEFVGVVELLTTRGGLFDADGRPVGLAVTAEVLAEEPGAGEPSVGAS